MSDDGFDLEGLANYLHLEVGRVARLAERGQVPGRRVGGEWRFVRSEIHHWLETRIGDSDTDELERMETALARDVRPADDILESIAELMPIELIEPKLAARTRDSAIRSMIEVAGRSGWLWDSEKMADAVRSREDLHPTALDNGVALLHPRRPLASILDRPLIALGRINKGIPFGGSRGTLTDLFFLLCSTNDRNHLHTLARLSRLISDGELLDAIRSAETAREIHEAIVEAESALP